MTNKIEKAIEVLKELDGTQIYEVLTILPMQNLLNIKQMIEHIYFKDLISEALQEYKDEEDIIDFDDESLFEC